MSFSGFSEDEIRKLNNNRCINEIKKDLIKGNNPENINNDNTQNNNKELSKNCKNTNKVESFPVINCIEKENENEKENKTEKIENNEVNSKINITELNSNKIESPAEIVKNIDEFEAKQKRLEEENKRRKKLLTKALADRTKRTREEAQRLNSIEHELKKLDQMLSNDVRILRKQIEIASVDYTESEKKYLRIEKEFMDAKLKMQQKLEKKEMLTEHLCAIIEKNEERKAEKLMELLKKLQIKQDEVQNENVN